MPAKPPCPLSRSDGGSAHPTADVYKRQAYALLHIFGYAIPVEELAQFRQWGSLTPGHPEVGHTPGIDATTGPLGQGVSMAVGDVYKRQGWFHPDVPSDG